MTTTKQTKQQKFPVSPPLLLSFCRGGGDAGSPIHAEWPAKRGLSVLILSGVNLNRAQLEGSLKGGFKRLFYCITFNLGTAI